MTPTRDDRGRVQGVLTARLRRRAWEAAAAYAVFAGLWILLSDRVLGIVVRDPDRLVQLSVYKGALFVVVTAVLLLLMLRRILVRVAAGEALLEGQNRILAAVAEGRPLHESLDDLVRFIESHAPGMLCSVLLLDDDGQRVRHGAGPSLPKEYMDLIDGLPIGPLAGSCGTAAYTRAPVYVRDIATDPRWAAYKDFALPHGLVACWSTPILDAGGKVTGTFAMYYGHPALPRRRERHLITIATQLAAVAIGRTRVEAAFRESEARLKVVVENLSEGLIIADPDGEFLHWNPAALRMLGFDRPEEGRQHQREFARFFEVSTLEGRLLPPEQWPLARVRRGERLEGFEVHVRRHDSDWERIFSYSGAQVETAEARRLAFVTLNDVTERRRSERLLRELNTGLEQRVEQRTAELRSALERAESADRLKSAFLATMSHELRTPLNSIIGFTGIVLQKLAGPLNDEQARQLEMVRWSARHLLALINDVLDLSKIEAGQLEMAPETFSLAPLLERIMATLRPQADRKGLRLRLVTQMRDDTLHTDPRRLEQVLLNLLSNAVKFTESGEVTLTARDAPALVRDGQAVPQVGFDVCDTGPGIAEQDLSVLFLPFRQLDTGLARRHEGTGLGLSISRRLVDLLGGEIEVKSSLGRGSTFTVIVPTHLQGA